MKRIIYICLFFLTIPASYLLSQEQGPGEIEPIPPKRSAPAKLGGGGGFTPSWLFLNIDPLNQIMRRENLGEFRKGGMFMTGGQGYAYILFVPNLRVGGMGAGGSMTSKTLSGNTIREVELSVGFGGVTVDYVVPIVPRLDLTIGALLGGGSMDLTMTRDYGLAKVWDGTWRDFGSMNPAGEYSEKLSGSFFVLQPSINLEYAILRWVGFRLGVSYLGMWNGDWKKDDKFDIYGVPSEISGKGFMINSGIFVGTFIF